MKIDLSAEKDVEKHCSGFVKILYKAMSIRHLRAVENSYYSHTI